MRNIALARHGDGSLSHRTATEMYRLRYEVFHDRLGWEVSTENGLECDEFDKANPVYVVVKANDDRVVGCWRMLPTTGPNMLRDTFPQLLNGRTAPQHPTIWELSRFAVATSHIDTDEVSFGLSTIPIQMMQTIFRFAQHHGISRYVTVTTVALERLIAKSGVNLSRLALPVKIGRVMTVAVYVEIDEITEFALFGTLPEHAERIAA